MDRLDLGEHHLCLDVNDLDASIDFYRKLGFVLVSDHREESWGVMRTDGFVLALYQGHIERNLMNFRGGDIEEIGAELSDRGISFEKEPHLEADGSWSAEIRDPDGNVIYFNTFPDEREEYLATGRLLVSP